LADTESVLGIEARAPARGLPDPQEQLSAAAFVNNPQFQHGKVP
jgi:hypothetical protein